MNEKEIIEKIKKVEAGDYDVMNFLNEITSNSEIFEKFLQIQLQRWD